MSEQHQMATIQGRALGLEKGVPARDPFPYAGYDADEDEGLHLRDYWRAVRKRLWLVAGVVALVTLLVAVYVARQPDIFVAQARVQVDLESPGPSLGTSKDTAVIINNPVNDPTYFNTQLQILTSPALLRRVAKTLDLERNPAFLGERGAGGGGRLLRAIGFGGRGKPAGGDRDELPLTSSVAPAVSRDDLAEAKRLVPFVKALKAALRVEPVKETRTSGSTKDTRLIDITYRYSDPQVAAKVVNAVADAFVLTNLEKRTETNASTGTFLQRRVAELQGKIRSGEEELANYARAHQILSLDNSQNIVVERLAGLNRQLLEAENERKMAEAAYRAGSELRAADAMAEASSRHIGDTRARLDEVRQKREQMSATYTDNYQAMKALDKEIAELERQLKSNQDRVIGAATVNLETRYRQARAREQAARADLDRQRGETLQQNDAAVNYRIIQQEVETNKKLLDGLLQRSRENDVVLAGTPNNISVSDYALAPESPVGPKRSQGVILALLLSTAFGVALSLFLEYLNDTVRTSEDVEKFLGMPALSVIPSMSGGIARLAARGRRRAPLTAAAARRPELLTNADARSALAESYRHLRTSVLLSRAGQPPRTLLVSSSVPSEGKTTTSVNTAVSLAQTGAPVVIIDADMRRPTLHNIFSLGNKEGLSTILSQEPSDYEMLALVRRDEASGLYVLTSGPPPPNPAELLGSEQMRRLVALLGQSFTYVVIDSPPVVSFTDAVLISTIVDGVLLVVHGGRTSRTLVRRSRQLLQEVGGRILGVVLNNVVLEGSDYYYYSNYESYNGQQLPPDAGTLAA